MNIASYGYLKKIFKTCLVYIFFTASADISASEIKTIFSIDLGGVDLFEENLSVAQFGQDGELLASQNGSLQFSTPYSFSVGAGIASDHARALFELYRTEADIDNFNDGSLTSTSLYYAMYWTDSIPYIEVDELNFIVGAGIGLAQIKLDDGVNEFLSDEVISVKATLGLEYAFRNYLSTFIKYELSNFGESSEAQNVASETVSRSRSRYDAFNQSRFSVGINFYY